DQRGFVRAAPVDIGAFQFVPPVTVADVFSMLEDEALDSPAKGVLVNDSDPQGLALTATVVQSTAHGSVSLNSNGSFHYVPVADFNGVDSFTYRASDGGKTSNETTATITVAPV